jgi:hypothetical protein
MIEQTPVPEFTNEEMVERIRLLENQCLNIGSMVHELEKSLGSNPQLPDEVLNCGRRVWRSATRARLVEACKALEETCIYLHSAQWRFKRRKSVRLD